MRLLAIASLTCGLLAAALLSSADAASADVGIERVSRSAGEPGQPVTVTLGCGFCFPPCHGKPGHRNTPCMLDTKRRPPRAFPLLLTRAGDDSDPVSRLPFVRLGRAVPPSRGDLPRRGRNIPRYRLRFRIPDLRPGLYAYVIRCGVCRPGPRASLIASAGSPLWRLRVLDPSRIRNRLLESPAWGVDTQARRDTRVSRDADHCPFRRPGPNNGPGG